MAGSINLIRDRPHHPPTRAERLSLLHIVFLAVAYVGTVLLIYFGNMHLSNTQEDLQQDLEQVGQIKDKLERAKQEYSSKQRGFVQRLRGVLGIYDNKELWAPRLLALKKIPPGTVLATSIQGKTNEELILEGYALNDDNRGTNRISTLVNHLQASKAFMKGIDRLTLSHVNERAWEKRQAEKVLHFKLRCEW